MHHYCILQSKKKNSFVYSLRGKLCRYVTNYRNLPVAPRAKRLFSKKVRCLVKIIGKFHQPKTKSFRLARYLRRVARSISASLLWDGFCYTVKPLSCETPRGLWLPSEISWRCLREPSAWFWPRRNRALSPPQTESRAMEVQVRRGRSARTPWRRWSGF